MKIKRREFIRKSAISGGLAGFGMNGLLSVAGQEDHDFELYKSNHITIEKPRGRMYFEPLERIHVKCKKPSQPGQIQIVDGQGNIYLNLSFKTDFNFKAGGTLGYHIITLKDASGKLVDWSAFSVDCHTHISDENNVYSDFMDILYKTLNLSSYHQGRTVRYNHKFYTYYSSWLQDHVFVAEAMKYFRKDIKSGIDLYADGQREDGLIWDNYKHPYPEVQSYWEYRFHNGEFTYRPEDPRSSAIFVRIPVENIGEHTFIEGLYYAWKASGDTEWMKNKLDHALKAVEFVTTSSYYWSDEKKLLKRPFTIDRWDFQSDLDTEISETGNDFMSVNPGKTHYGIMFGDNICMANACYLLAEMLQSSERNKEANNIKKLGKSLWQRINELSWKKNYYLHWYSLNPDRKLDFGVDTTKQVTLSNAMALIRGLEHDKCVKIIKTYLRIKEEMPDTSPGEWYMCYPPFEKGWHINKWEYMNGGVSPILAGDLALGAFENGFESYGTDILDRLHQLAKKSDYILEGCYKGKMPESPERDFTILDIKEFANIGLVSDKKLNSSGWIGSEDADFRNLPTGLQKMNGVPFEIIAPETNNNKSCIAVGRNHANNGVVSLLPGKKAHSLYILHTMDGSGVAGTFYIHYDDGTCYSRYINESVEIGHYWYPEIREEKKGIPVAKIAWRGPAKRVKDVGIYSFGMNNPYPDKKISKLEFVNPQSSNWFIFGITLSNGPHFFEPSIVSTIPKHWGAAHVMKALIEGLAGIKNTGLAFNKATLSPRWEAAGIKKVKATAKYEPSDGYLSYIYQKHDEFNYLIEFTSSSNETELHFFLPQGKQIISLKVNSKTVDFNATTIEKSTYIKTTIKGIGVKKIDIKLK